MTRYANSDAIERSKGDQLGSNKLLAIMALGAPARGVTFRASLAGDKLTSCSHGTSADNIVTVNKQLQGRRKLDSYIQQRFFCWCQIPFEFSMCTGW